MDLIKNIYFLFKGKFNLNGLICIVHVSGLIILLLWIAHNHDKIKHLTKDNNYLEQVNKELSLELNESFNDLKILKQKQEQALALFESEKEKTEAMKHELKTVLQKNKTWTDTSVPGDVVRLLEQSANESNKKTYLLSDGGDVQNTENNNKK